MGELFEFLDGMTYSVFILIVAATSIAALLICAFVSKRKIWVLDRGFLGSLVIFYLLWWIGDALAIKSDFYQYNPRLLLGIWIGGIPLEDHFAGLLTIIWARGLFDLWERKKSNE